MANLSNINNKFLVTTGGNVLIGATADTGFRLHVTGGPTRVDSYLSLGNNGYIRADTANMLRFQSGTADITFYNSSNSVEHVRIKNNTGNVGIGTDSPEQKLHVEGASITVNRGNDDSSIAFQNSTSGATWRIGRDYSNSEALIFAYSATDYPSLTGNGLISIDTSGNVTIGTTAASNFVLSLRGGVGGFLGWDDSANKTILQAPNTRQLSLRVNSDTFGAGTEALLIDSSGNSTFSGSITGTRAFFNSGTTNVVATFTSTDGTAGIGLIDSSGSVELSASGDNFQVQPAGGVAQLTVSDSITKVSGMLDIIGSRSTYVQNAEDDTATSHIFTTDALVGDFAQLAGSLVLQARVNDAIYRDIILAGGLGTAANPVAPILTVKGEAVVQVDGSFLVNGGLTCNPMATIEYSDISTGENRGLRIVNTSGTDQQWNITTGITGQENESFCIRDSTANVNALTMAISSGNATFAGNIDAVTVTTSNDVRLTASDARLRLGADGTGYGLVQRGQSTTGTATRLYFGEDADSGFTMFRGTGHFLVSSANVGIGVTGPTERLTVDGVIANRTASADPNFTVAANNMSIITAGSLQFTQGFAGTSSAGDTIVFRYNAISWKSWSLDYTFSAANGGLVKGTIAGYNNNSGGGSNGFVKNDTGCTVVATNSGQNVIVTFTANFGIHMMCDMRYSQGGGDSCPVASRASLTFNS